MVRLVAPLSTVSLMKTERLDVVSRVVHWMAPLMLLTLHLLRGLVLNGSHLGTRVLPSVLVVLPPLVSVLRMAPFAGFRDSRPTTR